MTGVPDSPPVRDRVTAILTLAEAEPDGGTWHVPEIKWTLRDERLFECPCGEHGLTHSGPERYVRAEREAVAHVLEKHAADVARRLLEALDTIDRLEGENASLREAMQSDVSGATDYDLTWQALNGGNESGDDG